MSDVDYWREQARLPGGPEFAAWAAPGYERNQERFVEMIEDRIPFGAGRFLDVGCGPGRLLYPLARRWPRCEFVGVDITSAMLGPLPVDGPRNVSRSLFDGKSLRTAAPPLDRGFHAAWATLLVQHLPRTRFHALAVTLRQFVSGRLVLQYVSDGDEGPRSHPRSPEEMERLLARAKWTVKWDDPDLEVGEWRWLVAV